MPQSCDSCGIQQEREVIYEKTHHKEAFSHQSKLEIWWNSSFLLVTVSLNRQTNTRAVFSLKSLAITVFGPNCMEAVFHVYMWYYLNFLFGVGCLVSVKICESVMWFWWEHIFSREKKKRRSSWENKVVAFSFLLKFNEVCAFSLKYKQLKWMKMEFKTSNFTPNSTDFSSNFR